MSWWDTKTIAALATSALKTAQNKIDKVLDIKEETDVVDNLKASSLSTEDFFNQWLEKKNLSRDSSASNVQFLTNSTYTTDKPQELASTIRTVDDWVLQATSKLDLIVPKAKQGQSTLTLENNKTTPKDACNLSVSSISAFDHFKNNKEVARYSDDFCDIDIKEDLNFYTKNDESTSLNYLDKQNGDKLIDCVDDKSTTSSKFKDYSNNSNLIVTCSLEDMKVETNFMLNSFLQNDNKCEEETELLDADKSDWHIESDAELDTSYDLFDNKSLKIRANTDTIDQQDISIDVSHDRRHQIIHFFDNLSSNKLALNAGENVKDNSNNELDSDKYTASVRIWNDDSRKSLSDSSNVESVETLRLLNTDSNIEPKNIISSNYDDAFTNSFTTIAHGLINNGLNSNSSFDVINDSDGFTGIIDFSIRPCVDTKLVDIKSTTLPLLNTVTTDCNIKTDLTSNNVIKTESDTILNVNDAETKRIVDDGDLYSSSKDVIVFANSNDLKEVCSQISLTSAVSTLSIKGKTLFEGKHLNEVPNSTDLDDVPSDNNFNEVPRITNINEVSSVTDLNKVSSGANLNEVSGVANLNEIPSGTNFNDVSSSTNLSEVPSVTNLNDVPSGTNMASSSSTIKDEVSLGSSLMDIQECCGESEVTMLVLKEPGEEEDGFNRDENDMDNCQSDPITYDEAITAPQSNRTMSELSSTTITKSTEDDDDVVGEMIGEAMLEQLNQEEKIGSPESSACLISPAHNSGHTSGDELETTTSSDIEIVSHISTPSLRSKPSINPMRSQQQQQSLQHRRTDSGSSGHSLQSRNGEDIVDLALFKSLNVGRRNHYGDINVRQLAMENEKLMKKLAEVAEKLDARERRVLVLSQETVDLQEINNVLRNQLNQFETTKDATEENLREMQAEFILRISEMEKKCKTIVKERDSLKEMLQEMDTQNRQRQHSLELSVKEKDQVISELMLEGDKLSKQQLQTNGILKKLRKKKKVPTATLR